MSVSLGEKLRQAREERGISISEVAEQTRISSLYLKSIEDDNYKPLPGGIFNKGFVKAYAKYVGVDEQEALQDYARLVAQNEQVQEDTPPRYRPEVLTDERATSSLVPTIIFAAIILGLMTGGILFVVNYIQNQSNTPAVSNSPQGTSTGQTQGSAQPAAEPSPAASATEIRIEFAALADKVSVTSTVDGNLAYDEVVPGSPKTYAAQTSVKLRYYRGFADKVRIRINGKELTPPAQPARGNIEFEITQDNISRILESGRIVEPSAAAPAATPQPTPAAQPPPRTPAPSTQPPSTSPTPRPAFSPPPRRSPTPPAAGRPRTLPSPD